MEITSSIVLVDKRHYRKIAQDNWGLTDDQMRGMHVHHRIHRCDGGTNDPSNLFVCSPSFHRWAWHNGEEWIEWANAGAQKGVESSRRKRASDPEWALQEKHRQSSAAKLSHQKHRGTKEYSDRQRNKSLRSHVTKRRNWSRDVYDQVWSLYLSGVETGYKIGREMGENNWKRYSNMLKFASMGFSFEQLTDTERYLEEVTRIKESPIAHILDRYDD